MKSLREVVLRICLLIWSSDVSWGHKIYGACFSILFSFLVLEIKLGLGAYSEQVLYLQASFQP